MEGHGGPLGAAGGWYRKAAREFGAALVFVWCRTGVARLRACSLVGDVALAGIPEDSLYSLRYADEAGVLLGAPSGRPTITLPPDLGPYTARCWGQVATTALLAFFAWLIWCPRSAV